MNKAPRREVIKSWPFEGWGWACRVKLSCGHTAVASYRKNKAPKTVACYSCLRESQGEKEIVHPWSKARKSVAGEEKV